MTQDPKNLYYSIPDNDYNRVKCGLLEASATITKISFLNSTKKILDWTNDDQWIKPNTINTDINQIFATKKIIDANSTRNIIISVNLTKNIWSDCLETNMSISMKRTQCDDRGSASVNKSYELSLTQKTFIDDITFDVGNEGSYGTKFTFFISISYFNGSRLESFYPTISTEGGDCKNFSQLYIDGQRVPFFILIYFVSLFFLK